MCESYDVKTGNEVILKRPKQALVMFTILALTLVTATSNGLYRAGNDRDYLMPLLSALGVLIMLILTEWKGRRVLFMTLFALSLLCSLIYLLQFEYFEYPSLCVIFHAPVQGSAIALLYIVISEYCDPKRRFFYLIVNSVIQTLFFWITLVLQSNQSHLRFFGDWLQYVNVILGVFGLCSVFKWPESPYWLASKRRFQESAKAFVEIRGESESEELRVLTDAQPRPGSIKMFLAPLLIAFTVLSMAIPSEASFELYQYLPIGVVPKGSGYWMFLALKCVAALLSVLTALLPIHLPRKVLLLLTCGFFFSTEFFFAYVNVIAIFPAFVLETILDFGPRTVTLPLLIEIIPQKFVNSVTAFVSVLYVIIDFFQIKYQLSAIYLFSLVFGLVAIIIGYFIMPETKEKTLIEIEQLYVSKKDKPQAVQTVL